MKTGKPPAGWRCFASHEPAGGFKFVPQELKVLHQLARELQRIGSANDAADHGYREQADRMQAEACSSISELLEQHPFLEVLLPKLRGELETGNINSFGWSSLLDEIEPRLSGSE